MTAVGVFLRMLLGQAKRRQGEIKKGAVLCSGLLPTWNPHDGSIDMYYWFYGTLAMRQIGGAEWNRWDEALRGAVVQTQREDGDYCAYRGSWDPIHHWGRDGGRVNSTPNHASRAPTGTSGCWRAERVGGAPPSVWVRPTPECDELAAPRTRSPGRIVRPGPRRARGSA